MSLEMAEATVLNANENGSGSGGICEVLDRGRGRCCRRFGLVAGRKPNHLKVMGAVYNLI